MKKGLLVALALVFALGVSGTAFAAANPFTDLPAKHWAYDAISKLARAGILDGYGDGTYRGDRIATRYEIAQATAKAMSRADKVDAQMKAVIDRLSVEFADELNTLGVRVTQLEETASTIKFSGDSRLRVQTNFNQSTASTNSQTNAQERIRLNAFAPLNDKVSFQGRASFETNSFDVSSIDVINLTSDMKDNVLNWEIGQLNFRLNPKNTFSIGRMAPSIGNGFVSGVTGGIDAMVWSLDGPLKATVGFGDWGDKSALAIGADAYSAIAPVASFFDLKRNRSAYWADLSYDVTSKWKLFGSAFVAADTRQYPFTVWSFGIQGQLGPNWLFKANYAWNTAQSVTTINKAIAAGDATTAWAAQIQYKGAKRTQAGSWGMYVNYRDMKPMAMDYGLSGGILENDIGIGEGLNMGSFKRQIFGAKGWGLQGDYTLFKNLVLTGTVLTNDRTNSFFKNRGDATKVIPSMYLQANLYF